MTDDNQWKPSSWNDQPSSPQSGDAQNQQDPQRGDQEDLDQTAIRSSGDWGPIPGSSPSSTTSPQSGTGPAPQSSAGQPPAWQSEPTSDLSGSQPGGLGQPGQPGQQSQPGQWSPSGQQPGYPAGPGQPSAGQYEAGQYGAGSYGSASYNPGPNDQGPSAPGQYPQQGGFGAPPGGYPPASQAASRPASPKAPSFLSNLFDLTFTKFVTPIIVKVVYILVIVVVALWYLGAIIAGFSSWTPILGLLALLLGWIPALLAIAVSRLQLEYIVALIRTSEYSRDLRNHFIDGDGVRRPEPGASDPGIQS